MRLKTSLFGHVYTFGSMKEVLAKANEEKSGDRLAGIAAETTQERIAAKVVLSEVSLADLRENPVIPYEQDEVTRVIEDGLDETAYGQLRNMTVGEFREALLESDAAWIEQIRGGLTAEMVAAAAKLMGNLDLVYAARKMEVRATCNTTIGGRGVLASRLQPNHTTDRIKGIMASLKEGLSYGIGDALIGLNPVGDSVDNVCRILHAFHDFTEKWRIPTQNCVLAHITTQMEALHRNAPMDLMFQSLAGSEHSNRAFGIDVRLLDEGHAQMREAFGPKNCMYFETGQGSELSSDGNFGADQVTMEARCYGLARRYHPFLVNTVVGFIGPEYLYDAKQVIRAGLEDHFMGKLMGLPMGCDACYTNHMKADQNDIDNLLLLLANAGCNYFIGVPCSDDIMLMYQSTSYHDIAAARAVTGKRPIRAFEKRMEELGILQNGDLTERAGDPSVFAD